MVQADLGSCVKEKVFSVLAHLLMRIIQLELPKLVTFLEAIASLVVRSNDNKMFDKMV